MDDLGFFDSKQLLTAMSEGVVVLDENGRFQYVNPAFSRIVAHTFQVLQGRPFFALFPPSDHPYIKQKIDQHLAGQQVTYEAQLPQPDGRNVHLQINGSPSSNKGILLIVLDITQQKQLASNLEQQATQLASIVNSANAAIISVTEEQLITLFNPAAEEMFGYKAEEVIGTPLNRLIPARFRASHLDLMKEFGHTEQYHTQLDPLAPLWAIRADDQEFPIETSISKVMTNGKILYTVILRDISLHKQARDVLKHQAELLQKMSDAVIITDLDFQIQSWNSAAEQLYGWQEADVLGKNIGIISTTYVAVERETVLRQFRTQGTWQGEVIQQHRSGRPLNILASVTLVRDEANKPISVLAINRDITERKNTIASLIEEKNFSEAVINSLPGMFCIFNQEGKFLRWNANVEQVLGYTAEEIAASNPNAFFGQDDKAVGSHHIVKVFTEGESAFEAMLMTKGGQRIPYFFIGRRVVLGDELCILGVGIDISERHAIFQRNQALVQSLGQIVYERWFENGRIVWSGDIERILGYTPAELGTDSVTWQRLVHHQDLPTVIVEIQQASQASRLYSLEYRMQRKDGRYIWINDRGLFLPHASGSLAQNIGVLRDINQRKVAEEALRASEARLQQIIETVPEGVLLFRENGEILLTNPVAKEYLALLAFPQTGRWLTHLAKRPLQSFLIPPAEGLWHEIRQDNRLFWVVARPIENSPETKGWVMVLNDVTETHEIQQRAERQGRLAAVGQLAAGIAHDFNNIMAVITLYTQLIGRTVEMPPKAQKQLGTIEKQADRAKTLIQQILDFSSRAVIEQQPLDVAHFMEEIVALLKRMLTENIDIHLKGTQKNYVIRADASRLQQMLLNLAVNARDAMPDGGTLEIELSSLHSKVTRKLALGVLPPGQWLRIRVADTGSGIPPDVLPHIFEPFYTTKGVGKGTGLGLAQLYGIVQQHQGHIDVVTQVNEGTSFVLYFPLLHAITRPLNAAPQDELRLGNRERILLLEDDDETRRALVDTLALLNYEVVEARNGLDGLSILQQQRANFALILSDVVMPKMGGIELLRHLEQEKMEIKMIFLTGHPLEKEQVDFQSLHLAGWMQKPPTIISLSQLLARVIQQA